MSGVTRDYSSPSLSGRRLTSTQGTGRRHTMKPGSQLLKAALQKAAERAPAASAASSPAAPSPAPAPAPAHHQQTHHSSRAAVSHVRRDPPPSRFATQRRRDSSSQQGTSEDVDDDDEDDDDDDDDESSDNSSGAPVHNTQSDEDMDSSDDGELLDSDIDEDASFSRADEQQIRDQATQQGIPETAQPLPITTTRPKNRVPARLSNHTRSQSGPVSIPSSMSRSRLSVQEKAEMLNLQKSIAELLNRASLCIPKIVVVNDHIEEVKTMLTQAVDELEAAVQAHKDAKSSPEAQSWRSIDKLISQDTHASGDLEEPREVAEEAKKIQPSDTMVGVLMDMDTTVTRDFDSPSLRPRSLGAKKKDVKGGGGRYKTADPHTLDMMRKAVVKKAAAKAVGAEVPDSADAAMTRSMSGKLLGTPQNRTRALNASVALSKVGSGGSESLGGGRSFTDPMKNRVVTQAIKVVGQGVTSDFDSPRLGSRQLKRGSTDSMSRRATAAAANAAVAEASKRNASSGVAGPSPAKKKKNHAAAMSMLQGFSQAAPAESPEPKRPVTPQSPVVSQTNLARFAMDDLSEHNRREEEEKKSTTPKPSYLRKIDTSVFESPRQREKTAEQVELERLVERAEVCLGSITDLDPASVRRSHELIAAAVGRLEAYTAMLK